MGSLWVRFLLFSEGLNPPNGATGESLMSDIRKKQDRRLKDKLNETIEDRIKPPGNMTASFKWGSRSAV